MEKAPKVSTPLLVVIVALLGLLVGLLIRGGTSEINRYQHLRTDSARTAYLVDSTTGQLWYLVKQEWKEVTKGPEQDA